MSGRNIGQLFPGWRAVRSIGAGGFGEVYEIERDHFGKTEKAALKVIRIPQDKNAIAEMRAEGYDDASIRRRMKSELEAFSAEYSNMRKLTHTNIVNCDDIEWEADSNGFGYTIYLKMELLTPLMQTVSGSYDAQRVTVKLGKDICSALSLCRSRNVVHRDIKPQNLFINDFGDYKLGDFGIAREMAHTAAATKAGTFKYMAPEVFRNQEYGHNVDVYSLGLVMYWLLNEKRIPLVPLPPRVPTISEEETAVLQRLNGAPLPAPKNGSAALQRIVLKACEPDRLRRYRTADEMLADLNALDSAPAVYSDRPNGFVMVDQQPRKPPLRTGHSQTVPADAGGYADAFAGQRQQQAIKREWQAAQQPKAAQPAVKMTSTKTAKPSFWGDTMFDGFITLLLPIAAALMSFFLVFRIFDEMQTLTTNPQSSGSEQWIPIIISIAVTVGAVVAFIKRHRIGTAGKVVLALLYGFITLFCAITLIQAISSSASSFKASKPYISVQKTAEHDNVSMIRDSKQADWVYNNMESLSKEDKKYYVFKNCTVDTVFKDPQKEANDPTGEFTMDGSTYRLVVPDLGDPPPMDVYEQLDPTKHYDLTCYISYIIRSGNLIGSHTYYYMYFESAKETAK